jgi:hypothetical protein
MPDPAADVAFFIDGEGASGQFMFFSVDLRTLERTPIFGPAASMPSIMKDATKDEYYTYGQPFQRELYGPWYEDWKKLLLCNP